MHPPSLPDLALSLDPATLPRLSLQLLAGDPAGARAALGRGASALRGGLPRARLAFERHPLGQRHARRPVGASPAFCGTGAAHLARAGRAHARGAPRAGPPLASRSDRRRSTRPHCSPARPRSPPELRDLLAARSQLEDLPVALRSRLEQGDGILRAADAVPAGAPWTSITLAAGHLDLPAAFDPALHLPAMRPRPHGTCTCAPPCPVFARGRGQAAEIDLTAPGLPPEGFDLSAIPTSGPLVRAASHPRGGRRLRCRRGASAPCAGRHSQPRPARRICLIAHSTAGLVGRALAAEEGVSHLVTVGTPHAGAGLDALVPGDPAEGLRVPARASRPGWRSGRVPSASRCMRSRSPPTAGCRRLTRVPRRAPVAGRRLRPPPFAPLHPTVAAARAVVGQTDPSAFGRLCARGPRRRRLAARRFRPRCAVLPRRSAWDCVGSRVPASFGWTSGPDAVCRRAATLVRHRRLARGRRGPGAGASGALGPARGRRRPRPARSRDPGGVARGVGIRSSQSGGGRSTAIPLRPRRGCCSVRSHGGLDHCPQRAGSRPSATCWSRWAWSSWLPTAPRQLLPGWTRALHARPCGRPAPAAGR